MIVGIDHEARSLVAISQTFHRKQRESPVRSGLSGFDAKPGLEAGQGASRPGHRTAQIDTNLDDMSSLRFLSDEGIERHDLPDPDGFQAQELRRQLLLGRAERARNPLQDPENRQQGSLFAGKAEGDRADLIQDPGSESVTHRSSSPPIMLSEPNVGMTSAT